MKYIRLNSVDPYYNLAVEEYLLYNSTDDIFMLWQNAPTVVIGKNQNAYAEVNVDVAKQKGIKISRRITGGGAVYHDLGNINYTFITSREKAKVLDYEYFTSPIINALALLGLNCSLSGRNDLECDGRKFSGNAQFCTDNRILHHGTILFDADVNVLSSVLKVDKEKLEFKAVKSHKSRVVNLCELIGDRTDVDSFIEYIEKYVLEEMNAEKCEAPQNDIIENIRQRNQSDEWIFSDKRYLTSYTVYRRKKYPFGIVNVEMQLNKSVIENVIISGDFFSVLPVEELENKLKEKRIDLENIDIDDIDVSLYIDKMSNEEFIELIKV
jgi:lipoate-protein ligase A